MRLLISNDDGVYARGIQTLANTLAEAGHQVSVVCPDRERSATGHGLTLHQPIRAEKIESLFHPAVQVWACSGTPSDCVKLAIWALLDEPPELVLSGINHGANLGTDVLYSGTVSAAMEGMIEGIPSVALSLTSFSSQNFQPAADFACALVEQLAKHPLPELTLLSVNVPSVARDQIRGAIVTRQGVRRYIDVFEKRVDPRGKTYYWLAGELLEDVDDPDVAADAPTDVEAIRENYITITPLHYNLTSPSGMKMAQEWTLSLTKVW
ncbi:5'/3'-nucleotidase SurE [Myxacorys almedinensis A]|uniref:5'-nucleotidase SurE n=2 Tax=Myxacorys TaxID=2056239 RepID=A0A8J8CI62_9CYAN|nr:5'/3'-nucleotidase SurE [Myxacorys almedinensis]NDJ17404.1 5'/3'-nucleotidase SurE [Myxacorys almedinensis A]